MCPLPRPTRRRTSSSSRNKSARCWSALSKMPLGRQAQGQSAARLAGQHDGRRRHWSGHCAGRSEREPAGRRDQLRRHLPDAPQVEAAGRRNRRAHTLGRTGGALAGGRAVRKPTRRNSTWPSAARRIGLGSLSERSRRLRCATRPGRWAPPIVSSWPGWKPPACRRRRKPKSERYCGGCISTSSACPLARRHPGLSGRRLARSGWQSRRPVAGLAAVRRALGPALAGPGAVWRIAGHEYDPQIPNSWQYRDYVIRA